MGSKLFLVLSFFLLSACGSSSTPSANSPYQGVWIPKDEGQELRSTGKLNSLCEEVRKDPNTVIINLRLVTASGATYAYYPKFGTVEQLKMGVFESDNRFAPSGSLKKSLGDKVAVTVSLKDDTLTFHYTSGNVSMSMDYLRSSDSEAQAYYAAEEACKH